MKKSFFEKSYLVTLLLFLVLLNGGIFTLAIYTYHNSSEAAKKVCRAEEFCIAEAYEKDYRDRAHTDGYLLQVSYGSFYRAKNIFLRFTENGEVTYSDIPEQLASPVSGQLSLQSSEGKRYLLISESICDGTVLLTYSKDVSYLDSELQRLLTVFVALSLFVSVLLAVLLYLIQRKLYLPLRRLQGATHEIADGNLSFRADDSGEDEFSALARDFNRMTDRINEQMEQLRQASDRKQQMLDDLAHEMRTPLTAIHGYAEYAFGVELDEKERLSALQVIMRETLRLQSISSVLLESAFLRENGIERKPVPLAPLLCRVAERASFLSRERGVTVSCAGDGLTVQGDETLLEELFSNLTENAVRACHEGGEVLLSVRSDGAEHGCVSVRDNGVGMTAEQLSHITEPFYRTDKARSHREGGTGLGLALCKRITEVHGAALRFSSVPGEGTEVLVVWD